MKSCPRNRFELVFDHAVTLADCLTTSAIYHMRNIFPTNYILYLTYNYVEAQGCLEPMTS
jgi:hypothetical protein